MKLGSDMGCKPASEIKASATQCSTGALLRMLRHGESQPRKQEGASHVSAARQGRRGVLDVDKSLRSSEMDAVTRDYIDSLEVNSVPWSRMFTAYGTAEHYPELLSELEQIRDIDRWKMVFNRISDFEHQSTLFPPAPFVLIFLVRHLRKLLEEGKAEDIAERMIDQFGYYIGIYCAVISVSGTSYYIPLMQSGGDTPNITFPVAPRARALNASNPVLISQSIKTGISSPTCFLISGNTARGGKAYSIRLL